MCIKLFDVVFTKKCIHISRKRIKISKQPINTQIKAYVYDCSSVSFAIIYMVGVRNTYFTMMKIVKRLHVNSVA